MSSVVAPVQTLTSNNNIDHDGPSSVRRQVADFLTTFNRLSITTLHELDAIYTQDITFTDPFHTIAGRDALRTYFESLYQRLSKGEFVYHTVIDDGTSSTVTWTMTYSHERINGGNPVSFSGCSTLQWRGDLVCAHRDYFDAGEMLYHHLPIVGRLIRFIRGKVS